MAGVTALGLCLLLVAVPAYGVEHKVGDSDGWAGGVDYDAWASGKTFVVGDTLLFKYRYPLHTVTEVSESDYKECSDANPVETYTDQNTKISLTTPGTRYFICATPGHCFGGMKLAVTVSSSAAAASTKPTPASPSATSTPSVSAGGAYDESGSAKSYASKVPRATPTSGAAVAGDSLGGKALSLVVASLLGRGLIG